VLVLLAGCGGSDESTEGRRGGTAALPTPLESAESAAAKLIDAARSGDCRRVARHVHGDEGLAVCRYLTRTRNLASIARWDGSLEVFGTAALGEMTDLDGAERYIVLALDPQRRFKFITITAQFGARLDQSDGRETVEEGIRALRDNDCEAFYRLSAQLLSAQQFCQATWVRDFQAAVSGADRVSEQSLGGNGYVSFFAVTADRSVYTVTLISYRQDFTWASAAPAT
jgi:hypothetical protein